jgi:hypothetical protein
MNILAFFTNSGVPATGLSPTIRIRELAGDTLVVTDAAMTEVGDGHYKYNFTGYDATIDYSIRCDGGVTLPAAERYTYAGNENYFDDMGEAVWSENPSGYDSITESSFGQQFIALLYGDSIYVDANSGWSGIQLGLGIGSQIRPVNNIGDAVTIADWRAIDKLLIQSSITIEADDNVSRKQLYTIGTLGTNVTLSDGASAHQAAFNNINLSGVMTSGDEILLNDCSITGTLENFTGIMNKVAFGTGVELIMGSWAEIIQGTAGGEPGSDLEIDIGTSMLNLSQWTGNLKLKGKTADNRTVVNCNSGNISVDATCVSGTIQLLGVGALEADNSGPNCNVETEGFVTNEFIADQVWDEPLGDHGAAGSTGRKLQDIGASVILTGTTAAATANTISLDSFASTDDGAYDPALITIVTGTGIGQSRGIFQYNGTTRTAVVDRNWKTLPTTASGYVISAWPGREHVNEGLAQAGTASTITLNTLASDADNAYVGQVVFIRSGTGEDQVRAVTAYDGTTKIATLEYDWDVIPDTTSAYVMLPYHVHRLSEISSAIWDAQLADHTITGTYGTELATKADLFAAAETVNTLPTTGAIVFGDNDGGDWTNVYSRDSNYWTIGEDGTNGLNVEFKFYLPSARHKAGAFRVFGRYEGTPSTTHFMDLWAYNYESMTFEQLVIPFMPGGITSDDEFEHEYYERNIDRDNNNEVRIRIRHNPTTYVGSHQLFLDFVELTSILNITAEDIAQAVWSENVSGYTNEAQFGGLVNNGLKRLLGLMHENIFIDRPIYDGFGNLTSARVRIYANSASVGTSAAVIGQYEITAPSHEAGRFNTWSQIKV